MVRRLTFDIACAVSLVLCLAVVTFWVRSHWATDYLKFVRFSGSAGGGGGSYSDTVYAGSRATGLGFSMSRRGRPATGPPQFRPWRFNGYRGGPPMVKPWFSTEFQFTSSHDERAASYYVPGAGSDIVRTSHYYVWIPHWILVLLTCLLPFYWIVLRRRRVVARRRQSAGLCPRCGYDLRATPGRCPECGAAVPPAEAGPKSARAPA